MTSTALPTSSLACLETLVAAFPPQESFPRLLPLGDGACTLELGREISPEVNAEVTALATWVACAEHKPDGLLDVVPSFCSLTLVWGPAPGRAQAFGRWLLAAAQARRQEAPTTDDSDSKTWRGRSAQPRRWRLPMAFSPELGPDLTRLADSAGLSLRQLTDLFLAAPQRVYLLGFMPGFPYMGPAVAAQWPLALVMPRLAQPRKAVPAGSVAVAAGLCCIYPWLSPGGWHLLGRMPLPLFEPEHPDGPAWLAAGDEVRWQEVPPAQLPALAQAWRTGRLSRRDFLESEASPPRWLHLVDANPCQATKPTWVEQRIDDPHSQPGLQPTKLQHSHQVADQATDPSNSAPSASSSAAQLEILSTGPALSVQDAGRHGWRHLGMAQAGWLDGDSADAANALVGNPPGTVCLEWRGPGWRLRVHNGPVRLAWLGTDRTASGRAQVFHPRVSPSDLTASAESSPGSNFSRRTLAAAHAWLLQPGDELLLPAPSAGVAYLAVAGGLLIAPVLGSCSTHARSQLGGWQGRTLTAGDRLPCVPATSPDAPAKAYRAPSAKWPSRTLPAPGDQAALTIRVILGPQAEAFSLAAVQQFFDTEWSASAEQDRMGLRLQGPALTHRSPADAEMISDAVVPGAIQVPANGLPIVLLADCQTVGGYPKLACVIQADLPLLSHARPGRGLRFVAATLEQAEAAWENKRARQQEWQSTLQPAKESIAWAANEPQPFDDSLLASQNLISGMLRAE